MLNVLFKISRFDYINNGTLIGLKKNKGIILKRNMKSNASKLIPVIRKAIGYEHLRPIIINNIERFTDAVQQASLLDLEHSTNTIVSINNELFRNADSNVSMSLEERQILFETLGEQLAYVGLVNDANLSGEELPDSFLKEIESCNYEYSLITPKIIGPLTMSKVTENNSILSHLRDIKKGQEELKLGQSETKEQMSQGQGEIKEQISAASARSFDSDHMTLAAVVTTVPAAGTIARIVGPRRTHLHDEDTLGNVDWNIELPDDLFSDVCSIQ